MKIKNLFKCVDFIMFFALASMAMPAIGAQSGDKGPQATGEIAIYNFHENEYVKIRYRDGQKILPDGIKEIEHIMRSRGDGSTHKIDLRLIEILDKIQHHFNAETVELISGYRSPAYNNSLIETGHGAARESLHKQGMASDIHLDEVDEEALFNYVASLGIGGAGIYPRYNFVHVDAGPPRTWREAPAKERVLVGTQNNPNPAWAAITDRNVYKPGEQFSVDVKNSDYGTQRFVPNIWIERFRKGQWTEQTQLSKSGPAKKLDQGEGATWKWEIPKDQPLGKYRLVIFASKDLSLSPAYSNEFYVR